MPPLMTPKKAKKLAATAGDDASAATDTAERKAPRARRKTPTGPALVIVESPAKARTIGKFLGGDFEVRASMGHVRDLPKKGMGIKVEKREGKDVFVPTYEVIPDKTKVVKELQSLARNAPKVYFATDLDREGEAIAWHLVQELDVPQERRARVTFHEITKRAIDEAFHHPGEMNENRVDAQQARRVLDRIVGYPLSRLLSKSISRGLSAGRVQSVAVRLIVDREKEIRAFQSVDYWRVFADLAKPGAGGDGKFTADLVHIDQAEVTEFAADAVVPEGTEEELAETGAETGADAGDAAAEATDEKPEAAKKLPKSRELRLPDEAQAQSLVDELTSPGTQWRVESVEGKRRQEWAGPPLITSTLQQQASIRLRWATKHAMKVAQELYEGVNVGEEGPVGLITYMRTDSVSLAPEAVAACRAYVARRWGAEHVPAKPNHFKSKQGAQEAHEAIRPTDVDRTPESVRQHLSKDQHALYKLVWERFVSCQMAPAQVDTTVVRVRAGRAVFEARGRVTVFAGWRAVGGARADKEAEPTLPVLTQDERLDLVGLRHEHLSTKPPPRYSEATLVKRLEKEGIGRPSTYAETISKILARKYVEKTAGKFKATELGEVVIDRMLPYFGELLDPTFTRKMEDELDDVESGTQDWQDFLRSYSASFDKEMAFADVGMVKEKFKPAEGVPPCETCGKPMVVRFSDGRKFYGCSGYPECTATRRAEGDAKPAAIPTEHVCAKCGKGMVIRSGRRGPFLACSGYPECKNAMDIDAEGKPVPQPTTDEKCEQCGADMVVRKGRRGPFLACSAYPKCRNARDLGAPRPTAAPGVGDALLGDGTPAPAASAGGVDPAVQLPPCPKCGSPTSIRRSFRGAFCGCTRYPECKGTAPVPPGALPKREPPKPAGVDCPDCGKPMIIRQGRRGPFAGCSGYPKCRNTMPMEDVPPPAVTSPIPLP
jgi:DNA topoisomerase I